MSGADKTTKGKSNRTLSMESSSSHQTRQKNKTQQQLLRHKLDDLEHQRRRSIRAIDEEERGLLRELEVQRQDSKSRGDKILGSMKMGANNSKLDDLGTYCRPSSGHRFSLQCNVEIPEECRRSSLPQSDGNPEKQWLRRQKVALERMAQDSKIQQGNDDSLPSKSTYTPSSYLGPPLLNRRRNSSTQQNIQNGKLKKSGVARRSMRNDENNCLILDDDIPQDHSNKESRFTLPQGKTLHVNARQATSLTSRQVHGSTYGLHDGNSPVFADLSGDFNNNNNTNNNSNNFSWSDSNLKKQRGRIKGLSRSVNDILSLSKSIDKFKGQVNLKSAISFDGEAKKQKTRISHSESSTLETFDGDDDGSNEFSQRNPKLSKGLSHFNRRITEVDICNGAGTSNRVQLAPLAVKPSSVMDCEVNPSGLSKNVLSPMSLSKRNEKSSEAALDTLMKPKLEPIKNSSRRTRGTSSTEVIPEAFDFENQQYSSDMLPKGANSNYTPSTCGGEMRDSASSSGKSGRRRKGMIYDDDVLKGQDVVNDTQTQWDELGQFLGEIRRQHNLQQAKLPRRRGSSVTNMGQWDDSSQKNDQSKIALHRRHSESNVLLLTRAIKGVDHRNNASSANITKESNVNVAKFGDLTSDQPATGCGNRKKNTTIKKLASIHTVLQNSALSMADLDSETF